MQTVDNESLYEIAESRNEVTGTACTYDGVDDDPKIGLSVTVVTAIVHELLDDICILLGEVLAHLRAGIL